MCKSSSSSTFSFSEFKLEFSNFYRVYANFKQFLSSLG